MSLPRNTPNPALPPSHSLSPTKSSLRRISAGGTTTTQSQQGTSRSLLPSPHFDEPQPAIISGSHEDTDPHTEEALQQDAQTQQPQHPFQPFFALIEDTLTHEHHHPTVHYIFADDDADIITEAALRSLALSQPAPGPEDESATSSAHQPATAPAEAEFGGPEERYLPPPRPGVQEHYIVLDVAPSQTHTSLPAPPSHANPAAAGTTATTATAAGTAALNPEVITASTTASASSHSHLALPAPSYEVTSATSLSPAWQVVRTGIMAAPTLGDEDGEGLMLRIEGRGSMGGSEGGGVGGGQEGPERERESVEEMIERFGRGLEEVRGMLGPAAAAGEGLGERGDAGEQ